MTKSLLKITATLILVLGLATSASAAYWSDTTGTGSTLYSGTSTPAAFPISIAGVHDYSWSSPSTDLHFTFHILTGGGWVDGHDFVTVTLSNVGSGGTFTQSWTLNSANLDVDAYLSYGAQFYTDRTFTVSVASLADSTGATAWKWTGGSLSSETTTPVPAAVWLLGSGVLGVMGFKRSRKNAA